MQERPPTGGSSHLIINGGACSPRRVANGVCGSPDHPPIPPPAAPPYDHSNCSEQLHKSCACVNFIAEHTKAREEATKVRNSRLPHLGTRDTASRDLCSRLSSLYWVLSFMFVKMTGVNVRLKKLNVNYVQK